MGWLILFASIVSYVVGLCIGRKVGIHEQTMVYAMSMKLFMDSLTPEERLEWKLKANAFAATRRAKP